MPNPPSTLRLLPSLDELPRLVEWVELTTEENGLRPADSFAITLALEELFANTLRHASPPATFLEAGLEVAEGVATVTYADDGGAFDPTQQAAPDTTLAAEDRAIGGLGIEIIRRTMQNFRYGRLDGRNLVSFERHF